MRRLSFWEGVFILVGTQVGAGVLSLPFAIAPLGFFWGTVAILLAGGVSLLSALCLLEALYLTGTHYHYYDLSRKYLGKWGILLVLIIILSSYLTLSAYLSGYTEIFPMGGFFLWVFGAAVIFLGLKASGRTEKILSSIILFIFLALVLWTLPHSKGYYSPFNLSHFAVAFNFCIFAFFSHTIVPEVAQGLKSIRRTVFAVLTAFAITSVLYTAFALSVAGAVREPSQIGTLSLTDFLPEPISVLAYVLPLLTIATSFVGVGYALKDMVAEIVGKRAALPVAIIPPLLTFSFQGFAGFIFLASFGLLIAGGFLPPLLAYLARKEAKKKVLPIDNDIMVLLSVFFGAILLLHLGNILLSLF